MLTEKFMDTVAKEGFAISEQLANEKHEIEWQKREAGDTTPRVPLLERKPLEASSDWTLEVLRAAAGNPYRYESPRPGRGHARPLVLSRSTSVGEAMANVRNRLTYITALVQEFDVPMEVRLGPNSHFRDVVVDLIHEATSFFSVIEIAAVQENNFQLRSSAQPA
jgi:hypothetical protein